MSEVTRYTAVGDGIVKTDPAGPLVKWNDYVTLKAEVDELRLENGAFKRTVNEASAHYDNRLADIARLKAELDEYRKAATIAADSVIDERNRLKAENARLKGEEYAYSELGSLVPRHLFEYWIAENARIKADLTDRKSEADRLKAEVERLKAEKDQAECDHDNCQKRKVSIDNHRFDLFEENKKLKDEVERLRASSFVTAVPVEQYERVIKAGDKMANTLEKDEQRYNGCPSAEAEMWWIARDGGCP